MIFFSKLRGYLLFLITMAGSECQSLAAEMPPASTPQPVVIGLPESAVQDIPKTFRNTAAEPILKLVRDHTGVNGQIRYFPDGMSLATDMSDGKIQIGIFQGHEFAWAKAKFPDIEAVVVAVPMQPIQAFCVVGWDSKAKQFSDLAKEKISLSANRPDFCDLFLAQQKQQSLKGADFAGQIEAASASDAIFDVIDGKAGCTVVDGTTLKFFEEVQPGAFKNIRVLSKSEIFPNPCIAIRKNDIDAKTAEKFTNTMLNVQNLPGGSPLLTALKLKGFAKVPSDYEKSLKIIAKRFPTPVTREIQSAVSK